MTFSLYEFRGQIAESPVRLWLLLPWLLFALTARLPHHHDTEALAPHVMCVAHNAIAYHAVAHEEALQSLPAQEDYCALCDWAQATAGALQSNLPVFTLAPVVIESPPPTVNVCPHALPHSSARGPPLDA